MNGFSSRKSCCCERVPVMQQYLWVAFGTSDVPSYTVTFLSVHSIATTQARQSFSTWDALHMLQTFLTCLSEPNASHNASQTEVCSITIAQIPFGLPQRSAFRWSMGYENSWMSPQVSHLPGFGRGLLTGMMVG